jgi:hypothetical protein
MAKKGSDEPKNFAREKEWAMNFSNELLTDWYLLRSQRAERETRWQDAYDQWSIGKQDPLNVDNYIGRANIKYPAVRKEIETMSRRLVKAMFPEDYLKAEPTLTMLDDMAIANTQVVRHYFDNVMNLPQKVEPWVKQCVMYGTSPLRTFWKKEENEIIYKKKFFTKGPDGQLIPDMKRVKEKVTKYEGPVVRTEDMFQTWAYPSTANDPSELKRTYWRTKVNWQFIEAGIKKEIFYLGDERQAIKDSGKMSDIPFDMKQQQLQSMGDSGQFSEHREQKLYDYLECWGQAVLPNGELTNYVWANLNENPRWCIRLQQNPYWHQSPPFNWGRFIKPPGNEFYGRGLPEAIIDLGHMLNDVLNQGMDSATYNLSAITIINPAFAPNADSFEVQPGAVWWADPNAVKPLQFPDLTDVMMKNMNGLKEVISQCSDNTPQLPDPLAGKARSTGQAQLAINEWQTDLYSFVNSFISESMEQTAMQVHSMLQQNLPDETLIRVAGKYSGEWINRVLTPADICGNLSFKWMGAIQVENQSVKTQQMLNFLKIYPSIPPQAGVTIDWGNLITMLLRDGFQIKNPETIVSSSRLSASVAPFIEDKILILGGEVEVCVQDDDDAHMADHKQAQAKLDKKAPEYIYTYSLFDKHIADHEKQKQDKIQQQQQAQMQQQQQMAMAAAGQKPPAGATHRPSQHPPNPMGNQQQMSQGIPNQANLAKGVRP